MTRRASHSLTWPDAKIVISSRPTVSVWKISTAVAEGVASAQFQRIQELGIGASGRQVRLWFTHRPVFFSVSLCMICPGPMRGMKQKVRRSPSHIHRIEISFG